MSSFDAFYLIHKPGHPAVVFWPHIALGGENRVGIQHYLVTMTEKILTTIDKKYTKESYAVLATYIIWDKAFPRLCPKIGVESFLKNGVRPSLIPLLIKKINKEKCF